MGEKTFKFNIGEKVLNRHGLTMTIAERKVDKRYGHIWYYLKEDTLKIGHAESHLQKLNN